MKQSAFQQCIIPSCSKEYPVLEQRTNCNCGNLLDVRYSHGVDFGLIEEFSARKRHGKNIYDESGVW